MAKVTYDRFDVGLDLRKHAAVADANRLRQLTNAYVTTGKTLKKRHGFRKVATLEAGTKGLVSANGVLNTFYESGAVGHANPLFSAHKVAHPTTSQDIVRVHFGDVFDGFLYVSVEYADGSVKHHYLDGTFPTHIVDPLCPNSKAVVKGAEKIFGTAPAVIRYCATGAPRDWTTADDAGFLPFGLRQTGHVDPLVLGEFQKQLVAWALDGAQIWDIDPDPTLMELRQRIYGVGCQWPRAHASFASDIFFRASPGYRSITVNANFENFQDTDVGSPIDDLVQAETKAAPTTDGVFFDIYPLSIYYPNGLQFWSIIDDSAWVYSYSKSSKIAAWSFYTLPFVVNDAAILSGDLYVRSGNSVYVADKTRFTDDGSLIPVTIEMPFVDAKLPGTDKQWSGVDGVIRGTATIKYRYDPNDETKVTTTFPLIKDTRPGDLQGVEVVSTSLAPIIEHSADEDFSLDMLQLHYEALR